MPLYDYECGKCRGTIKEDMFFPARDCDNRLVAWCPKCGYQDFELKLSVRGAHDWGNCGEGRYIEAVDKSFTSKGAWKEYKERHGLYEKFTYG